MKVTRTTFIISAGIALAVLLLSCNRKTTATLSDYKNFSAENQEEIASFRKTGCFGFCPIYRVYFYENGQAVYIGNMNVEKEGKHFGFYNKREFKRLVRKAEKNGFFMMADVYPTEEKEFLPDLSNTITTIIKGKKNKTVTHNHSGPEKLKEIESKFAELIDSIQWISVEKMD